LVSVELLDKINLTVLSENHSGIQKNLGQATKQISFCSKTQNLGVVIAPYEPHCRDRRTGTVTKILFFSKKSYLKNQSINFVENSFILFGIHSTFRNNHYFHTENSLLG